MGSRYDVAIIGGGHNGLVAAAYLARAHWRVVVLERRKWVGGAAVTEEIIPGFRTSRASYAFSLFRPQIYDDLDLGGFGLRFHAKDPQMFVPLPDGRHFFVWRDEDRTAESIAEIHAPDGEGYRRFQRFVEQAVSELRPFVEAPDPPSPREVAAALERRGRADIWKRAVAGSAAELVSEFFASEEVRGAFASQGIIGTFAGPREEGTAWVLTYHHLGGELAGGTGVWCYVTGGMGSVSDALAACAREAGAEIRTDAEVASVVLSGGEVAGVELSDGEIIEANAVVSNAHPQGTFSLLPQDALPEEWAEKLRRWEAGGCVVKVNLALRDLPEFRALPGEGPQHRATLEIAPSLDYLQEAWDEARRGSFSTSPFMEVFCQSAVDETLVEGEGHVVSAFCQYAPRRLFGNRRRRPRARRPGCLCPWDPGLGDGR